LENPDEGDGEGMDGSATPDPSATVKETASSLFVTEVEGRKRSHNADEEDEEGGLRKRKREGTQD